VIEQPSLFSDDRPDPAPRMGAAPSERDLLFDAETHDWLRRYIARAPWTFAKTMPWAPHEYTVRGQTPRRDFEAFAQAIRVHGRLGRWGANYVHHYLDVDGHQYWTMGWPVVETTIINRQELERSDVRWLDDTSEGWGRRDRWVIEQWAAGTHPKGPPAIACHSCQATDGFAVQWEDVPWFACRACGVIERARLP